jgi:hypothetical protein
LFYGLNPVQETSGANILANILPGFGIDEFLTRTMDRGSPASPHFDPSNDYFLHIDGGLGYAKFFFRLRSNEVNWPSSRFGGSFLCSIGQPIS